MHLENYKIPALVCLAFLITSPIGQMIFGYAAGFLVFITSEVLPYSRTEISVKLMVVLSILSLFSFYYSKEILSLLLSSILSTFFICSTVLLNSIYTYECFYPDRYILGSIISFIFLSILVKIKDQQLLTQK